MVLALGRSGSLVVLFVVLPIAVGVVVMTLIGRSGPAAPPGTRTSELLASGERVDAEVIATRTLGSPFDPRPMVQVRIEVHPADGPAFELTVVQSMPRRAARQLTPGRRVEARLAPGRTVGAVVVPTG